jgi:hypothetical protein
MKYLFPLAFIGILCGSLILPSCYPNYGLTTTDYRTIVTVYDTAANFDQLRTYYLIDSVFHVKEDGDRDTITRQYDQRLLDAIDANYRSYGWTRITDTAGSVVPATLVRVSVTTDVTSGTYWQWWYPWYPSYGGGWWGYPGWGWGWYYPPGYWGTYSYSTGSLIVQQDLITPPADPSDSVQLRPIWIAASNGLLTSSESSNVQIISYEIRQMFDQSPYLSLK